MKNLKETTFINKRLGVNFAVMHNHPDTFGLAIEDAFDSWIIRTEEYTADNFVEYVRSKKTGYICMTRQEFDKTPGF